MNATTHLLLCTLALVASSFCSTAMGQKRSYPSKIDGAESHVYKKVGDLELMLWVFAPKANSEGPVPAMIFFFGGGWANGSPEQLAHQSRHLAQRVMAGILAD